MIKKIHILMVATCLIGCSSPKQQNQENSTEDSLPVINLSEIADGSAQHDRRKQSALDYCHIKVTAKMDYKPLLASGKGGNL